MIAAACTLVAAVGLLALGVLNWPVVAISPDGRRYLAAGAGKAVALPFALRWLLPKVCGASITRWRLCTLCHLALLPPLVAIWLSPWIAQPGLRVVGGLLICGLPGVWRIHIRWPVLIDGAAMAWSLGAAILLERGFWPAGVAAALIAGCIKETAPVFAACYAWNPVALVGLAAPLLRRLTATVGEDLFGQQRLLADPFLASRLYHAGKWFDPLAIATPWGVGLLAVLTTDRRIVPILVVTLVLAYAQVLVATDTSRLYQWAAPPVILGTVSVVPPRFVAALLLVHLLNPWAGSAEV